MERLLKYSIQSLSSQEILTLILRSSIVGGVQKMLSKLDDLKTSDDASQE